MCFSTRLPFFFISDNSSAVRLLCASSFSCSRRLPTDSSGNGDISPCQNWFSYVLKS